jgi:hypothetical protein
MQMITFCRGLLKACCGEIHVSCGGSAYPESYAPYTALHIRKYHSSCIHHSRLYTRLSPAVIHAEITAVISRIC